tara:strand:- start:224 stop:481 length:258 start_codon:yes stop_codon:yes gene_type:complete
MDNGVPQVITSVRPALKENTEEPVILDVRLVQQEMKPILLEIQMLLQVQALLRAIRVVQTNTLTEMQEGVYHVQRGMSGTTIKLQ